MLKKKKTKVPSILKLIQKDRIAKEFDCLDKIMNKPIDTRTKEQIEEDLKIIQKGMYDLYIKYKYA